MVFIHTPTQKEYGTRQGFKFESHVYMGQSVKIAQAPLVFHVCGEANSDTRDEL